MARLVHGFDNAFEITGMQVPNRSNGDRFQVSLILEIDGHSERVDQMRHPVFALQLVWPPCSVLSGWLSFQAHLTGCG